MEEWKAATLKKAHNWVAGTFFKYEHQLGSAKHKKNDGDGTDGFEFSDLLHENDRLIHC